MRFFVVIIENTKMKAHNIFLLLFLSIAIIMSSCTSEEEEQPNIINNNDDDMEMMDDNNDNDANKAPEFSLVTTDGTSISSSQFENKNLVIFFFGYNCPPCRAVGPDIESKLHQQFKDNDNFAIIGADQWEGNNAGVNNFESATGITFPLGVKGASMANDFGTTYDRLVVVNAEGNIIYRGNSIATNNLDEVIDIVKDLVD